MSAPIRRHGQRLCRRGSRGKRDALRRVVIVVSGEFRRLVDRAREIGLHTELVAGNVLIREKLEGLAVERRAIVELRVTHDSGRVLASEAMGGIGDRDRAAATVQERVRVLR